MSKAAPVAAAALTFLLAAPAGAQNKPVEVSIDLLVPSEIRPTGEHGTVVLEGDISAEGRVANLRVIRSSKSAAIDQFALKRYDQAPVGADLRAGAPSGIQLTVAVYNTRGLDFGADYSCEQAVLDNDWYKRTFQTESNERTPLYLLIRAGGGVLGKRELAFATKPETYERVWSDAIASCRSAPKQNFLKVLIERGRG